MELQRREKVDGKKTFLICPVRGVPSATWEAVVATLEGDGWIVHFPPRDTLQEDIHGLRICCDNRAAIEAADMVHEIWDGASQGCLFDLGMAFALHKPLTILSMPPPTPSKSFPNMVRMWAGNGPKYL